ncbi:MULTISPECIES: CBS domain-containing protein [unclassified Streptomyces]|uniref:CBS domain-containing protein n=1 Tax=unclassified Streptomyces TaxID=2593676 RepID=UPI000CD5B7E0|nr:MULTISPECIES: CBS domain-containing protein [unclassified Streptomyces]
MYGSAYTVREVMSPAVVAVGREARFREIVRTMERWRLTALPVLAGDTPTTPGAVRDGQGGVVVGMVSAGDLLPTGEFRGSDPGRAARLREIAGLASARALTAHDLMSGPAVTVECGASVARAAHLMARRRVKRLPVVDAHGRLAGLVSRTDLLKVYLRPDQEIAREVRDGVVGCLFPGEGGPVTVSVTEGVVTLRGNVSDEGLLPVTERLVLAVDGVVEMECRLTVGPSGSTA